VRASARPLLQAACATPIAWFIATHVLGHDDAMFAPISALVAIGVTNLQPWQRAVEIVVGVAIGVVIADLLSLLIGQGTWQIGVMVLFAMGLAVFVGGSTIFVTQAGVAAVLIASLPSQGGLASLDRFVDTLVGGVVALAFTLLLLPVRPMHLVQRALGPTLDELAGTFELIGDGLRLSEPSIAERALTRARATGDHWARLNETVDIGRQAAHIAPARRSEEATLLDVAETVRHLDFAIRDARVMARVAWRLTETGYDRGALLELAMREFAAAVRSLQGHLEGAFDETLAARDAAVRATRLASAAQPPADDIVFTHLVGQVRSTTVDVLRATGMPRDEAITRMLAGVAEGRGDTMPGG
jgi:uncharacterized membrane protein YgaE (UPF0421/DUF939 family)